MVLIGIDPYPYLPRLSKISNGWTILGANQFQYPSPGGFHCGVAGGAGQHDGSAGDGGWNERRFRGDNRANGTMVGTEVPQFDNKTWVWTVWPAEMVIQAN